MDKDWIEFCGLTCSGGSECRSCQCRCPGDCPMTTRADFQEERVKAQRRMTAMIRYGIEEDKKLN